MEHAYYNGEKMDEEVINQIEDYLDGNIQIEYAYRDSIGETIEYSIGVKEYIHHLIDLGPDLSGMRIGLDLANGSATAVAREVFESLGANIFVINEEPTGFLTLSSSPQSIAKRLFASVLEEPLEPFIPISSP